MRTGCKSQADTLDSVGTSQSIRTVIIGAGPRGTSVLERLLANWAANAGEHAPGASLHVDIVDPYPAGPGRVWRPDQSRLFLMNTQSFYPTVVPTPSAAAAAAAAGCPEPGPEAALAPALAGTTFDQWRSSQRVSPEAGLNAAERAELAGLESTGFPSRALYGRYLRSTLDALLQNLPDGVSVAFHEDRATAVHKQAAGGFAVVLGSGTLLAVDSVVLALGHVESLLNLEQRALRRAAESLGLLYVPPAVPADVDWSAIPAGEPVLVRGMGLNFFDVMGQLTEGRGGSFVGEGSALEYVRSGTEPVIIAASRRGTPYRTKATLQGYYPTSVTLRYLTPESLKRLAVSGVQPGFDHDLWPLLHRDALWAYYSTLVNAQPDAVTDPAGFLVALDEALRLRSHAAGKWEDTVDSVLAVHVPPAHRLELLALAAPLAGRSFSSRRELDAAVVDYLRDDALRSARGEHDPLKMTIGALHHGRSVLKSIVADGGITDESWMSGLRGWFESFVEGLASGPPALRAEQLAALVRAGVVSFVGPDPSFGVDRVTGAFTATSPWVSGGGVRARTMVEALAPANRVGVNDSPLLQQLLREGLVRPRLMMTPEGQPVESSGLDVEPHPYRALGISGAVTEGMYVLGLQLSATQWGTAIAAEAQQASGPIYASGQRTIRDADEIARDILHLP